MRGKTTYHLCLEDEDFLRCEELRTAEHENAFSWSFPMAYALRDGHVVGYLGTYEDDGDIVVGPLVLATNDRGGPFYAVRLLMAIHDVFTKTGILRYLVHADATRQEYLVLLEALGFKFTREYQGNAWYEWDMTTQQCVPRGG